MMAQSDGTLQRPADTMIPFDNLLRERLKSISDPGVRLKFRNYALACESYLSPLGRPFLPLILDYLRTGWCYTSGHYHPTAEEELQCALTRFTANVALPTLQALSAINESASRLSLACINNFLELVGGEAVAARVGELRSSLASQTYDPTQALPLALRSLLKDIESHSASQPPKSDPKTP